MEKFTLILMIIQLIVMVVFVCERALRKNLTFKTLFEKNILFFISFIITTFIWVNYGFNKPKIEVKLIKDKIYLESIVIQKAIKHNIPINIAKSLITQESNWNYKAISNMQAVGLCQVLPSTFVLYAKEDYNIMEPSDNVEVAFSYLEEMQFKNKNWNKTLGMYNGGKYWKTKQCQQYANEILIRAATEQICMK
jgi:soluble lytic murein transglycosylase-like protein